MSKEIPPEQQGTTTPIEIAFVNTPFHGQTDPSPIRGMEMQEFRNWLIRALEGDPDVPSGILAGVKSTVRERGEDAKKRDIEWWEQAFWLRTIDTHLREIDELVRRYQEIADWHHQQAAEARRKMGEAGDKLAAIDGFITGVDDILKEKEKSGKFDREKTIELLKSRGVAIDPKTTDETLLIELKRQKTAALGERQQWSEQYDEQNTKAGYHERQEQESRRKAEELIQKRDEIRSADCDPEEKARRLKEVTEQYKLDVQLKAAEIENLKNPNIVQANFLDATLQKKSDVSQTKQAESQSFDFKSLVAGTLKKEFTASAANGVPQSVPTAASASGTMTVKLGSPA